MSKVQPLDLGLLENMHYDRNYAKAVATKLNALIAAHNEHVENCKCPTPLENLEKQLDRQKTTRGA